MTFRFIPYKNSGNYKRYFSEDAKVNHISEPHTGKSAEKLISTTVIVPYTTSDMPAMTANVLTTPVFVMGENGVGMIALLPYRGAKRRRWARSAETQLG